MINLKMSCFWNHLANLPKKITGKVYLMFIRPTLFPWKHSFSYFATEHSKHAHKIAHRISQNSLHLAYQAHEKHTQDEARNKELFSGVIKRNTLSKIKIDKNCGKMLSIKMSVNLYRILKFTFRKIWQTV